MRRAPLSILVCLLALIALASWPAAVRAATPPRLLSAQPFAALAGSTITNAGSTVLSGELGLDPGTSVTGFPPGSAGVQHIHDATAQQAQSDLTVAYNDAASETSTADLTGQDLGGKNLIPGVYTFSSSAQLTGPLVLSGNGQFIFQIGTTLTTASNSSVITAAGAQACGVWWQVGSSATIGQGTAFQGNLMALQSITMVSGASILNGRALARNGAITLDDNQITPPQGACSAASGPSPSPGVTPSPAPTPTPGVSPTPSAGGSPTPGSSSTSPTLVGVSPSPSPGAPTLSQVPKIGLPGTGVPARHASVTLWAGLLLTGLAGLALVRLGRKRPGWWKSRDPG